MNMHSAAVKSVVGSGKPAVLKNITNMLTLIETIRLRPEPSSGFGLFYGKSGYGKSVASTYAQNEENCLYIEIFDYYTRKDFCRALLKELGEQRPRGTISDMMRELSERLEADAGRTIIIDEADKLVDKHMIELVRDLQRMTQLPIILVGEEQLRTKLDRYERCASRVHDEVKALPCDVEDARELAGAIAPDIAVSDDLLLAVCKEAGGSTRRVVNALADITSFARTHRLDAVSPASYTPEARGAKYARAVTA